MYAESPDANPYANQANQYDQGQAQRSAANLQAAKTVNPSCFGTIEDAARNVTRLAERLAMMVDRLAGTPPPTPDTAMRNGETKGAPSGLLDEATARAIAINNSVSNMQSALNRLEKSLP
jgi:hypothetical protein